MLSFEDFAGTDALGWAGRIRKREVQPAELVEAAVARAEAVNGRINAIAVPLFERALDEAQRCDPEAGGPFAGVPFALKDLYQTMEGVRLTNGSRAFDIVGASDSELVHRHRRAGLVIICTSTSPELAVSAVTESTRYGATRNPWNLERTSGGSSGGASALVAAGVVPFAHATDGGGSIRGPASCCGLFGLKPSRGRLPIAPGRTEGWNGCSTTHAVTRSVRDSAALLDATHGPEPGSRYIAPPPRGTFLDAASCDPGRLRIAFHWRNAPGVVADPACIAAVEGAARLCESLGHIVEPAAPELDLAQLGDAFGCAVLTAVATAAQGRAQALGVESVLDLLEQTNREYAEFARRFTAVQLMQVNDAFMAAALALSRFQESYDVILTPTMAQPPIPVGTGSLMQPSRDFNQVTARFSGFTALYNMTGQPAMTVPLHWSDGLPIGVQFAGRLGEEELLFSLAAQLEAAQPWFKRCARL